MKLVIPLLIAFAWAIPAPALAGTLEGSATYRERIALPPDAIFEAVLMDVSRPDESVPLRARAILDPAGQPPFHFRITYDDAAVQPGHRYVVRATVRHRGRLLFTTGFHPVLEAGDVPPLTLVLNVATSGSGHEKEVELPASYEGDLRDARGNVASWHLDLLTLGRYQLRVTSQARPELDRQDDIGRWRLEWSTHRLLLRGGREASMIFLFGDDGRALRRTEAGAPVGTLRRLSPAAIIEPRLALTGMFRYMADAAGINLCADGGRLPVAMEGDYKALEAAYLKVRRQPGEALLVALDGLIAPRPSAEANRPPRPHVVVERFVGVWPRETCGNVLVDSPLRDTYWKLVRLGAAPVEVAERQREPSLVLASRERRVSGHGGCNRLSGSYEVDGETLRFSRMAGTMMACPAGMEQEQRFLHALQRAQTYRIRGSHLEIMDSSGAVLARLEAVALR
jgi:copper homeostasis protein (lipoprotein)